jgi:RNA polymerase sigma-70 factor (ECF subfamily)
VASPDELHAVFVAARAHGGDPGAIGPALVALCDEARRDVPPDVPVDPDALTRAIAAGVGDDIAADLARVRAGELALALAAGGGSAPAIAAIERELGATVTAVCRRFAGPGHGEDDLRQILRERLFVTAPDRPATITEYNGLGSLGGWVRVVATRLFIDLGRSKDRAREQPAGVTISAALAATDLALDAVKAEYRAAVASALIDAVDQLDPGDRHLLRQHLVAGLTIDQLGAVLGIHRATAARRVARAREQLAARTRELVAARLELDTQELAEVCGLVLSGLDLSIRTLLQSRPVEPA